MNKLEISSEPMDVDISLNSTNTSQSEVLVPNSSITSIKENTTSPIETWNVKTFHIKIKTDRKKSSLFKGSLTLFVLCAAVIVYLILDINCMEEINLIELKTVLKNRVYDQSKATDSFVDALDQPADSKIIFLYGPTGVGKTYTISLFLENILNSSNIYHYTMPSFMNMFSIEHMYGLNICKMSIVVVDDLKRSDLLTVKELILKILKKSDDLHKKLIIILVVNCDVITKDFIKSCDNQYYRELTQTFEDVHVVKKFIKYELLTQNSLEKCIDDVLTGQKITNDAYNNLLNNFDVNLDGCKSVYKKVKFLQKL